MTVNANIRIPMFFHSFQWYDPKPPFDCRKTVSMISGVINPNPIDENPPTKLMNVPTSGINIPIATIRIIINDLIAISETFRDLLILSSISLNRISIGMKNISPKFENKATPIRACPAIALQSSVGRFKVMLPLIELPNRRYPKKPDMKYKTAKDPVAIRSMKGFPISFCGCFIEFSTGIMTPIPFMA